RALPAGAPRREYPDAAGGRLRLSCDPGRALAWLVMKHLLLLFVLLLFPAAARAQAVNFQGVAQALTRQAGLEGRILWIDATANIDRLNSRQAVAGVLDRCRSARINTVVVEVKPISGQVRYHSRIAPRLT